MKFTLNSSAPLFSLWLFCVLSADCWLFGTPSTTPQPQHHGGRAKDGSYGSVEKNHYTEDGAHSDEFDHDVVAGSHKMSSSMDSLSPEESRQRLLELYEKMDQDGNKYVDRLEMHKWIVISMRYLAEEQSAQRRSDVDSDADGQITMTEILLTDYSVDSQDKITDKIDQQFAREDAAVFAVADTNGDQMLSEEEFFVYSHPEYSAPASAAVIAQILGQFDLNKDGALNLEEYKNASVDDLHEEGGEEMVQKSFIIHDKNNDQLLNKDELINWRLPDNEEIATRETEHLFTTADDNKDNQLTSEEVLHHQKTFVGSAATDYGQLLADDDDEEHDEL